MLTNQPNQKSELLFKKDKNYLILSFLLTGVLSFLIYWAPYFDWAYLGLEQFINDSVIFLLNLTQVIAHPVTTPFPVTPEYADWGEASLSTPGVHIPSAQYSAYWIIKACTGMQAGAILVSIILVTPIPYSIIPFNSRKEALIGKHQLLLKLNAIILFLIILTVLNIIRIWFHLYLTGALGLPWAIAHDDLSKIIGFAGTLIFAWIIEKLGVPIIDTFADWLDGVYDAGKYIFSLFNRKNKVLENKL